MTDLAAGLEAHLSAAAVEDGAVPSEVAAYADEGCYEQPEHPATEWRILDDRAASWAMRKAAQAASDLARIDDLYAEKKKTLDSWRETVTRAPTRTRTFMHDRLAQYALARRDKDPKAKTLVLPEGKVATRQPASPWSVDIYNAPALLEWALADGRDDLVRPALRPKAEVLAVLEVVDGRVVDPQSGEVVPGVTAEPTRPSATVTPNVEPSL